MLVPLYGFLEGDTIGLLVLATPDMAMGELARTLAQMARVRVAPRGEPEVVRDGVAVAPGRTVAEEGLEPLARVDVRWRRP